MTDRTFAIAAAGALAFAGLAASPALSAIDGAARDRAGALSALVGRFTPATGEPALLERYANLSAEARRNFRFTPAMPRSENRAVTLVRRVTPMSITSKASDSDRQPQAISITPVTYRLGSAVGYTAFASNVSRENVDISALPQASRPVDPTARPSRFGADMRLDSRSLPGSSERALDPDRAYSVDVTGSYRLSRNVDLTAGVRLQRENDRLAPLTDDRRDSQAVYVGTQFRF
ncbi:MAG: hypothetical protein K2X31_10810 [Sphingopyxis sp.]|nr:hypothetical protein [Sphingopyxis sp.]